MRKDLGAYLAVTAVLLAQTVAVAAETLPVKKIGVDTSKQLVVEFGGAGGGFPTVPHVLDLPGPNHRVVLDFTDASIDKANLPAAEEVSAAITQALPFVRSVRFSNLENAPLPTARIVLDLPEDTKVKPRVVKLEQGMITISLGEDAPATATAPAPTPVTSEAVAAASAAVTAPEAAPVAAVTAPEAAPAAAPVAALQPAPPATTSSASPEWSAPATPVAETQAAPAVETASAPAELKGPIDPATGIEVNSESAVKPVTPVGSTVSALDTSAPVPTDSTPAPGPEAMGAPEAAPSVPESGDKKTGSVKRYNSAVQFHLQGKLPEAISEYKAALESNGSLAEAHSNLGLIYNQQHNYAQALSEFRKALAINPKDAITYNGIGAALRAEKDLQGAIKNWQTAVSLDPKLATAHYNLGTAYEINKEYDRALGSYNSAVKNDYRLGEAYYRMGLIMERKNRKDDAATQFQEALKVSGDSEYSEDARLRLAYLKKGKTK